MPAKRGKPKHLRVHIGKRSQIRAWAIYWGCSQQDVRDAAKSTGGMVEDVQDWLRVNVIR